MRRKRPSSILLAVAVAASLLPGSARGEVPASRGRPERRQAPSPPASSGAREEADRTRAAIAASTAEEARLATERVAAAQALQATESEVAARAAEVSDLASRRAATEVRLKQHAAALAPLLPLAERLALYPAETLLATPAPPGQALQGLGVLQSMARRLETEAEALRQDQMRLASDQAALDEALPRLLAVQAAQSEQARALDQQLAAARALRGRMEQAGLDAQRRAAAEAANADTLRAALATLEEQRARAETQARDDAARAERARQEGQANEARRREAALARPAGPGPDPRGALQAPVAGTVVRAWGEPTDAGPATGISYRPAPQARVLAPCGGRVRFAGPFRSFGALMILDCGGGYAFVLAGLARLDAPVGATVLAGEPVGTMPGWDATSSGARPALYLELRHDGQAVNPAPYLRGR